MAKGFDNNSKKQKKRKQKASYMQSLQQLCGEGKQAQTEVNRLANQHLIVGFEEKVRESGFTLLIHVIRTFYKDFGALNTVDFGYKLVEKLSQMTEGRLPETDGGKRAIEFLKTNYGYNDLV